MVGAGAVVTHAVPGHAIVAGSPAGRIGWACTCGERLLDSTGHPAPAERERYAIDQELVCPLRSTLRLRPRRGDAPRAGPAGRQRRGPGVTPAAVPLRAGR
jgi:hypothetical protein